MAEYKLYGFCLHAHQKLMSNLATYLVDLQAGNISAYVTACRDIQDRKDWYEDPTVKISSLLRKRKKFPQFSKTVWNCMIMQFSMYQTPPMVYLVRKEDTVLRN